MIVTAGIPHFFETILILLTIWYVVRLIANASRRNNNEEGNTRRGQMHVSRKEDDEKHLSPDVGEYVDYEEVKVEPEDEDNKD